MIATKDFGPDNPRDWDPNHALLFSRGAPYETAAVMRMQRAGHKGSEIMKTLKLKGTQLMNELSRAMDEEQVAAKCGRDIHDAVFRQKT